MKILAVIVAVFWFLSLGFLALTYLGSVFFGIESMSGEAGRFVMLMATVSVFGLAVLESK